MFHGTPDSSVDNFGYVIGTETWLPVSDVVTEISPPTYAGAPRNTMVITGFKEMSGSNAFAAKCAIMGYDGKPVPDMRLGSYTLNAIAVG
jgi:hypothetical protein